MSPGMGTKLLIADRIWIATALLHQRFPSRLDFTRDEIRQKMEEEGLLKGVERGSVNVHLNEHCVGNVAPSTGKYRMLFETTPGNLRLFCPGDPTHPARIQQRKASKVVPYRIEIPPRYWPLLDWYENWSKSLVAKGAAASWEDDPLIRLIGSGEHIWADEHADEYVENLRREDI